MEYFTPEEVKEIEMNDLNDRLERLEKEHFKNECFDTMYGKGYIDILDVPLEELKRYFKIGCAYSLYITLKGTVTALCYNISKNKVYFLVIDENGNTLIGPLYFSNQLNCYCCMGDNIMKGYFVEIEPDKIESRDVFKFKVL